MPLASGYCPRDEAAAGLLGRRGEARHLGFEDAATAERAAALVRSLHGNLSMVALKVEDHARVFRRRPRTRGAPGRSPAARL